jgi:hypothetical protein
LSAQVSLAARPATLALFAEAAASRATLAELRSALPPRSSRALPFQLRRKQFFVIIF